MELKDKKKTLYVDSDINYLTIAIEEGCDYVEVKLDERKAKILLNSVIDFINERTRLRNSM